jgi:hypothetical protein
MKLKKEERDIRIMKYGLGIALVISTILLEYMIITGNFDNLFWAHVVIWGFIAVVDGGMFLLCMWCNKE